MKVEKKSKLIGRGGGSIVALWWIPAFATVPDVADIPVDVLASLLFAEFPTDSGSPASVDIHDVTTVHAAAVIPDANGVPDVFGLPAWCCWLHYFCFCWCPYCACGPVVAFTLAAACVPAIAVILYIARGSCLRHCCCLARLLLLACCCCWRPLSSWCTQYSLLLASLLLLAKDVCVQCAGAHARQKPSSIYIILHIWYMQKYAWKCHSDGKYNLMQQSLPIGKEGQ